ncbi:hypothetical protein ACI3PM_18385, partial [Lactiplantibacillus plantarum]
LRPLSADLFGKVIQEVTSFFMLFEFVIMLIRYIEEGHHIPIFYAEDGEPIIEEATINHVADLFGKYGSNVWFEREAK